jgi:hypothetical protein
VFLVHVFGAELVEKCGHQHVETGRGDWLVPAFPCLIAKD